MAKHQEHSAKVEIRNVMGFHVRPVQRFAQLAKMFRSEVMVCNGDKTAPGTSVMNLMTLGGRHGDVLEIAASGEDARQCIGVLRFLAENRFFVEDNLPVGELPDRHLRRLASLASCFESEITATLDGRTSDAKDLGGLMKLGLEPTSEPKFEIDGADAEQARAVMEHLVSNCFFVEDMMGKKKSRTG